MTVTTTTARFSYSGDGGAGPDTATGIKVLASTDVKVYWNKATSGSGTPVTVGNTSVAMSTSGYLTLNTHYTVQNAGTDSDITITLIASGWTISSTLAYATSSDSLVVTREVPYTQPSNYQNNDTFDAETLEQSLDRSTMQIQQLSDVADRNIVFSSTLADSEFNSASVSGTDFGTTRERASTIVASKTSRANKGLKFDANGDIGISTYDTDTYVDTADSHRNDALDHRDTAEDYAIRTAGTVRHFDGATNNTSGTGTAQSGVYSSKEWAIGTQSGNTDGSAKQWALGGGSFAHGTAVSGSDYSAKEHAIGTTVTTGSSKQWATKDTSAVASSLYSAKEYASGDATGSGGSAKAWAEDSSSPDGTTTKSAKTWATEASTSASTAENSAIEYSIALG